MIPSRRLLLLTAALFVLAIAVAFAPVLAPAWLAAAGLLTTTAVIDFVLTIRLEAPTFERRLARSMALRVPSQVRLIVTPPERRRPASLELTDHRPNALVTTELPQRVHPRDGRAQIVDYEVVPLERGAAVFTGIEVRLSTALGLWRRRRFVDAVTEVRVYPDFSRVSRLLLQAVHNPLANLGLHLRRQRGEGLEFHQLRDYREGDSLRALDWKATARIGRMISREYRDERNQHVVFVIDSGRRMRAKDGELSHFDHTLNAMLLLAYVALRQGDSVSIMTVGEKREWLPPCKGPGAINTVLNHVYDKQPAALEVDYVSAATELAARQRRRALIVMLTNVRDEDSDDLAHATALLRRRHLVMLASLRERALDEALDGDVGTLDDALRISATDRYLEARRSAQDLLKASGVFVEDCLCDGLAAAITSRYLAIKRAGML